MTYQNNPTSLRAAALIAGLAILGSVLTAPYAELYVYPKLVVPYQSAETAKNIIENRALFVSAIFCYLVNFLCDIVIAWALYILLKPVNENLSLLTAWLRLVYAIIGLVALNNLVSAFQLLDTPGYLQVFEKDHLYAHSMIYLRAFRNHWYFGILFFGIHMIILGYLVIKARYIPSVMGVLLMIAGVGYLLTTVRPYVFPRLNVDFARFTFYGELVFMLWLLFRGSKLGETNTAFIPGDREAKAKPATPNERYQQDPA
jgi:hypothetical protein